MADINEINELVGNKEFEKAKAELEKKLIHLEKFNWPFETPHFVFYLLEKNKESVSVTIPDVIHDVFVTDIASECFADVSNITEIIFETSI